MCGLGPPDMGALQLADQGSHACIVLAKVHVEAILHHALAWQRRRRSHLDVVNKISLPAMGIVGALQSLQHCRCNAVDRGTLNV